MLDGAEGEQHPGMECCVARTPTRHTSSSLTPGTGTDEGIPPAQTPPEAQVPKKTADPRSIALQVELAALKRSALCRRAVAEGVTEEEMDEADDSDDPTQALIDAIVRHAEPCPAAETLPLQSQTSARRRAHFGDGKSSSFQAQPEVKSGIKGSLRSILPDGLHAMLSYQWCVLAVVHCMHCVAACINKWLGCC